MIKSIKNKGFTLAEVLITLVIIGVIAAMTIPTIINKTNNQEYVSKLKKVYSTLSQATNKIITEQGLPRSDIGGWATSTSSILNLYKGKLNYTDECSTNSGCTKNKSYVSLTNKSKIVTYSSSEIPYIVLNDGSFIFFYMNNNHKSCNHNGYGSNNQCAEIYADINGEKGPNVIGKDLFYFVLKENGLFPRGCDTEGNCNGPVNSNGYGCACKVLREGAINY